jgi:hypothetical protein
MATREDKAAKYGWKTDVGEKGRLQWVPLSLLKVDREIQRQISDVCVLAIARNFDWAQFGALDVNKRGDGYYVFDGQHRLRAIQKRGDVFAVPCRVHLFGDDRRKEAMALVERNTNVRRMDAPSKHRLRVIAEETTAMAVQDMLTRLGLSVGGGKSPNSVRFIALITRTFLKSPEACEAALVLQRQAIGDTENMHERIHHAMFCFVMEYGANRMAAHVDRLYREGGKNYILQQINSALAVAGASGAGSRMLVTGLKQAINKRLRTGKIPMEK